MLIWKVTMTKADFRFYKQFKLQRTLFVNEAAQNASIFLRFFSMFFNSNFLNILKKIPWEIYARFWKWYLKRTP